MPTFLAIAISDNVLSTNAAASSESTLKHLISGVKDKIQSFRHLVAALMQTNSTTTIIYIIKLLSEKKRIKENDKQ